MEGSGIVLGTCLLVAARLPTGPVKPVSLGTLLLVKQVFDSACASILGYVKVVLVGTMS